MGFERFDHDCTRSLQAGARSVSQPPTPTGIALAGDDRRVAPIAGKSERFRANFGLAQLTQTANCAQK
jgi:hypothetical protein